MENPVRSARERLGLTQIQLAEALGVDQGIISRMENNRLPVSRRTELALEALLAKTAAAK